MQRLHVITQIINSMNEDCEKVRWRKFNS